MLRRGALGQDASICALCQYRLTVRLSPPRHRAFSSTRRLRYDNRPPAGGPGTGSGNVIGRRPVGPVGGRGGGWGSPAFVNRPRAASPPTPEPAPRQEPTPVSTPASTPVPDAKPEAAPTAAPTAASTAAPATPSSSAPPRTPTPPPASTLRPPVQNSRWTSAPTPQSTTSSTASSTAPSPAPSRTTPAPAQASIPTRTPTAAPTWTAPPTTAPSPTWPSAQTSASVSAPIPPRPVQTSTSTPAPAATSGVQRPSSTPVIRPRVLPGGKGWGGGSWGSGANTQQSNVLSEHERIAREKLVAAQDARPVVRLHGESSHNLTTPKYMFNPDRQRAAQQSLQDALDKDDANLPPPRLNMRGLEAKPEVREQTQDLPAPRAVPPRVAPLGAGNQIIPDSKYLRPKPDPLTSQQQPGDSSTAPRSPGRADSWGSFVRRTPVRAGTPGAEPSRSSDSNGGSWGNLVRRIPLRDEPKKSLDGNGGSWGNLVRKTPAGPPPGDEPSRPTLDSADSWGISPKRNTVPPTETRAAGTGAKEENSGGWGMLKRKATPEESDKQDFWAEMEDNLQEKRSARASAPAEPERDTTSDTSAEPKQDVAASEEGDLTEDQAQASSDADQEETTPKILTGHRAEKYEAEPDVSQDKKEVKPAPEEKKARKERKSKRSGRRSRYDEDDDPYEEDDYDYEEIRRLKAERKAQKAAKKNEPIPIHLPELIGITALADALKIKHDVFLQQLGELGFEGVTLDSLMAGETAALVAQEYGFEPTVDLGASRDLKPRPPPEDPSKLPPRPPVVTIMGHVDHGKTTLLDYLRKSSVAAQEHGGITQHIGAFSVSLSSGKVITFLDTPGHAAFLTMRERGAQATDIVVLVVAADDSVKPQTLEALKHARAYHVPIVVAITKVDKHGADIALVKADLDSNGVEIEDFGGDVQVVLVSGKTGQGMEDLEENILTLSEILDLRAERDGMAEGWVLESSLKPIGRTATVLVKRGTLRPGDFIAAGLTWAKIRHMRNEAGALVEEAPPGTPVEILGWKDLPAAGDQVLQGENEDRVKDAVSYREGLYEQEKDAAAHEVIAEQRRQHQEKRARERAVIEASGLKTSTSSVGGVWNNRKAAQVNQAKQQAIELAAAAEAEYASAQGDQEGVAKMVNFVVKGDVHGSVEAVCAAILELGNHEVRPRVLRSAAGPVTEFDVEHAAASGSTIVNFATTTPPHVARLAEENGVRILDHNVIYRLVDDITAQLSSHLAPDVSSRVLGEAEVLQIFPINFQGRKYKNVAGCRVRHGVVSRTALYRIHRGSEKIFDGKLETLKHLKKDVTEMRKGSECGIGFEEFQDLEVGDIIQAYEEVVTKRSL